MNEQEENSPENKHNIWTSFFIDDLREEIDTFLPSNMRI